MDTICLLEKSTSLCFFFFFNEAVNFFIDRFEPLCWDITTLVILILTTIRKWVILYIVYSDTDIDNIVKVDYIIIMNHESMSHYENKTEGNIRSQIDSSSYWKGRMTGEGYGKRKYAGNVLFEEPSNSYMSVIIL